MELIAAAAVVAVLFAAVLWFTAWAEDRVVATTNEQDRISALEADRPQMRA